MENNCCHTCDGKGFARTDSKGVYGQGFSRLERCKTCHGTGQVSNDSWRSAIIFGLVVVSIFFIAASTI